MKKIKSQIISLLMVGLMCIPNFSCEDLLDVEAPHLSDDSALRNNPDQVIGLVYAAYRGMLNEWYTGGNEALSVTNCDITFHNGSVAREVAGYDFNPSSPQFNNMWSAEYAVISAANVAVKFIDELVVDTLLNQTLTAESKAIRAYSYFNLYRKFGTVPLSLKAVTDIESEEAQEELNKRRATVEEMDEYMETDLSEAIAGLGESGPLSSDPEKPYVLGRFTKDAARFIWAKYNLYRASEIERDGGDASDRWQVVIDMCNEILGADPENPPRYRLMDWYPSIFHLAWEEENTEWLFRVRQEAGPELSVDPRTLPGVPQMFRLGIDGGGFGTFQGTRWAYNMYEFGDSTRRRWTIARINPAGGKNYRGEDLPFRSADWPRYFRSHPRLDDGDSANLATFTYKGNPGGPDAARLKLAKFRMYPVIEDAEGNWQQGFPDDDRYMFRLAEVYLMMAEALNELNKNPTAVNSLSGWNAFDYVNIIRRRARNHTEADLYEEFVYNYNATEVETSVPDWSPGFYGHNEYIPSLDEYAPAYTNRLRVDLEGENYGYSSDYEAFHWEILWERARELTAEDICRLGDLRRRGILIPAMNHTITYEGFWVPNATPHPGGQKADPHEVLFPIPSPQIQSNPGLVQNPGF